ncbi:MAG: hypothetical protein WAU75_10330 [Solirubrobacteraceae bacterium]
MSDHDSFEDRLRAIADEISRSVQRISELDVDELSQRYGVDVGRARAFADAAGQWLTDHLSAGDPPFGRVPHDEDGPVRPPSPDPDLQEPSKPGQARSGPGPGPHPLGLPTDQQGVALSALDSGRWTVRPGSNQLAGTETGPAPAPSDVVGELRGRDWITADGTLTLVGRHALSRWCRGAEDPAPAPPEPDVPPT